MENNSLINSVINFMKRIFPYSSDEELKDKAEKMAIREVVENNAVCTLINPINEYNKEYSNERIIPPAPEKAEVKRAFLKLREMGKTVPDGWYTEGCELFVKQAKFMENFTDNFEGIVPFESYYPVYQKMNDSQLRTYFTWRTEVRKGNVQKTSTAYLYCYVNEILNGIGAKDCEDTIEKLIFIWSEYRKYDLHIDWKFRNWIRDYYIVNKEKLKRTFEEYRNSCPASFYDFDIEFFKKAKNCTWEDLRAVELFSSFKITNGYFYKNGDAAVINKCACFVLEKIAKFFKSSKTDFKKLFSAKQRNRIYIYSDAVHPLVNVYVKKIELDDVTTLKKGSSGYLIERPDLLKYSSVIGFILKCIEVKMRLAFECSHGLKKPDIKTVEKCFSGGTWYYSDTSNLSVWKRNMLEVLGSPDFEILIEHSIAEYLKQSNIIIKNGKLAVIEPVAIDLSKLEKIEKDHIATAKKLISEEEIEEIIATKTFSKPKVKKASISADKKISMSTVKIVKKYTDRDNVAKNTELSEFEQILNLLSDNARNVIVSIVKGEVPSNSELSVEEINEKALEIIGDNLIEYVDGKPQIYDDYFNEVKNIIGG